MAETIATFALVFAGTGAIIINDITGGVIGHLGVAITFGLVVTAMIYTVGDVSGAHLNPAVTIGFCLARRLKPELVLPYIVAQCIGALLASLILYWSFPEHPSLGATLPQGSVLQSFLFEIILTFILMFVILNVSTGAKEKGVMAGVAIGGVICFSALFAGPISGASMNPARSMAPAVFSNQYEFLWIYIMAPILGSSLAVLCCLCVRDKSCCGGAEEAVS